MATYIKLFTDYVETFDDMNDEEAGKLIKAILHYGAGIELPPLSDSGRLVFGIIKRQIDRDAKNAAAHRIAGRYGGRPKTNINQTKPNESEVNQADQQEPNEPKSCNEYKNNECKKKTIDEESIDICAETSPAPVATLPLVDGSFHVITREDADKDAEAYPAVDVIQEYFKMGRWCDANPKYRKTKSGIKRFINQWLGRAQNSAPAHRSTYSGNNDAEWLNDMIGGQ